VVDRWSLTARCRRAMVTRCVLFVLFYGVVANVPFWVASHSFGLIQKGCFDLSYALAGILALFLPRIPAAMFLLLAMLVDVVASVCVTFYLPLSECLSSFPVLQGFSRAGHSAILIVLGLTLLTIIASWSLPAQKIRGIARRRTVASLIVTMVSFVSVDVVYANIVSLAGGSGHLAHPFRLSATFDRVPVDRNPQKLRLARPSEFRLIRNEIQYLQGSFQMASSPVSNATIRALRYVGITAARGGNEVPNVVLILLESWGQSSDAAVKDALLVPYFQPRLMARYQVFQGTVPFFGSTVAGEGRELCGSKVGFLMLFASAEQMQDCIPHRLSALGFHDIALHGMDGNGFRRLTWYQTIGFQERWFGDRFRQDGLPDCHGAFVGTCDASVAAWIAHRLEKPEASPEFVYWVTLHSHLPVPVPTGLPRPASCSIARALQQEPVLCSWYQLVANVHSAVAQLAMTQLARPTVFIIVGDHAPPFSNPAQRNQFSSLVVPYLLLIPTQCVEVAGTHPLATGGHWPNPESTSGIEALPRPCA
jgi:hypothetical protein